MISKRPPPESGEDTYIQYARLTWSQRQALMRLSTDRSKGPHGKVTVPDLIREAVTAFLAANPPPPAPTTPDD